jgi:hypothetical protein
MAFVGKSLGERVFRWRSVLANEELIAAELPHLMPDLETLAEMEREAMALITTVARLRGELQSSTQKLRDLARRGDRLRTKVGSGLRSHFGFESVQLIRFGFAPRPERGGPFLAQRNPELPGGEPELTTSPALAAAQAPGGPGALAAPGDDGTDGTGTPGGSTPPG